MFKRGKTAGQLGGESRAERPKGGRSRGGRVGSNTQKNKKSLVGKKGNNCRPESVKGLSLAPLEGGAPLFEKSILLYREKKN